MIAKGIEVLYLTSQKVSEDKIVSPGKHVC